MMFAPVRGRFKRLSGTIQNPDVRDRRSARRAYCEGQADVLGWLEEMADLTVNIGGHVSDIIGRVSGLDEILRHDRPL
jgi:hypothetical protein